MAGLQQMVIIKTAPYNIGTLRYSYEHWVHSHPEVRPCDLEAATNGTMWGFLNMPDPGTLESERIPELAPRTDIQSYLRRVLYSKP